jgi:hypothetical protein
LEQSDDSPFKKDFERVAVDKKEAIIFLASIIPKRNKRHIRTEIEHDRDFDCKHHFSLGMKVRNVLRAGGFFYLPQTMDVIWFSLLKEAVNLSEDRMVLTDSIRKRIKKFRASIRRPRLRPPLDPREIVNIKEQLERRHNIKLPETDVKYSDNIKHAFCLDRADYPGKDSSNSESRLDGLTETRLRSEGLKDIELQGIDQSKLTIFLPKRQVYYPAGLYDDVWHELSHATAHKLKLKDKDFEESFAVTYSIIGLLLEAKNGKFTFKKACDQIESVVKSVQHYFRPWWTLPFPSLKWIEKYNPDLEFRDRDPDELLAELEKAIQDIVETDREVHKILQSRVLARREKPFIIAFAAIAVALLIISLILCFLHAV